MFSALSRFPVRGRTKPFAARRVCKMSKALSFVAGMFAATCAGYPVTGSANGTMNGNNVTINVSGAGSVSGVQVCPFQFTSNATIQDNGDTIVLPYSGTTCLGPISGTQTLHRP